MPLRTRSIEPLPLTFTCLPHQALCEAIQSLTTILSFPQAPQSRKPQRPLISQPLTSKPPRLPLPAKIPFPIISAIFLSIPWPLFSPGLLYHTRCIQQGSSPPLRLGQGCRVRWGGRAVAPGGQLPAPLLIISGNLRSAGRSSPPSSPEHASPLAPLRFPPRKPGPPGSQPGCLSASRGLAGKCVSRPGPGVFLWSRSPWRDGTQDVLAVCTPRGAWPHSAIHTGPRNQPCPLPALPIALRPPLSLVPPHPHPGGLRSGLWSCERSVLTFPSSQTLGGRRGTQDYCSGEESGLGPRHPGDTAFLPAHLHTGFCLPLLSTAVPSLAHPVREGERGQASDSLRAKSSAPWATLVLTGTPARSSVGVAEPQSALLGLEQPQPCPSLCPWEPCSQSSRHGPQCPHKSLVHSRVRSPFLEMTGEYTPWGLWAAGHGPAAWTATAVGKQRPAPPLGAATSSRLYS